MFERYNIVNDQDLRGVASKFQDYQGRKSATVETLTPKRREVLQFRHVANEKAEALIIMKDRKFGHNLGTIKEKGAKHESPNPLIYWCRVSESNQGHEDFQSSALPTELTRHRE